jgi:CRP-like cAMP-binding protein
MFEQPIRLEHLTSFINRIYVLPDDVLTAFLSIWQEFQAPRKTVLTRPGEKEKYLYFVTEGVQRAFYRGEDEKEATLIFSYPFSFTGVADSFLLQRPSAFYFETLTKSSFLRTSHTELTGLMSRYHAVETLISKAVSAAFAGALERQIELQCFSAEQKFRTLLKRSPHVLNLIPHKYLASYLGIDATTFSKLLGSVRIQD